MLTSRRHVDTKREHREGAVDRVSPRHVRDAIVDFISHSADSVTLREIEAVVVRKLGDVPRSSIRSYLNRNTPGTFERTERGSYRLAGFGTTEAVRAPEWIEHREGLATIIHADAEDWLRACEPRSFHAIVTDPPYGLVEYSEKEQAKLRNGNGGGVWRIPPSFDGNRRSPLPRFTTLGEQEIAYLGRFFEMMGLLFYRVTIPGANILVASNPLIAHYVAAALSKSGLEPRGTIVRLVMTMRGGDRPKNAHEEFRDVSVMPRSMWEPWLGFRRPLEGRVQDNLRKWRTGGFRRISDDQPFGDVIKSHPTNKKERGLAQHPSLKPQAFLRQIVAAVLPLGEGIVLDPFAGSGSTLAAANALGYGSVGIEKDARYFDIAKTAIAPLSRL
jgi:site-specific DNA-methyltransferase (adenine-specific)